MLQRYRVLLADSHDATRRALRALLSHLPMLEVAWEASSGQETVVLVAQQQPDLVILDSLLPLLDGFETTRLIKRWWPHTRIVLVARSTGERISAMAAGADGFTSQGEPAEHLLHLLRTLTADQPSGTA